MKNGDVVHELIHSLTPSEKRYFKLFSQLQPGTKNYIKLFDVMEGLEAYDSKLIKKKLKDPKVNLSYEKSYLRKMLLKSLRNFHDNDEVTLLIGNLILDSQTLTNKGQHHAAKLLLDEAITASRDNWRIAYLPLLYNRQGVIIRNLEFKDMDEQQIQDWENEYAEAIALNGMMAKYELLQGKMARKYVKRVNSLNASYLLELEEIMSDPVMQVDPETLPFYPHLLYLEIKCRYYMIIGRNYDQEMVRQGELWLNEKNAQKNLPVSYQTALFNAASGYMNLRQLDQMEQTIEVLRNTVVLNQKTELKKLVKLVQLEMKLLSIKCVPGEATAWLNKNMPIMDTLIANGNVYERYHFLYLIGWFFLSEGNPARALDYFNQVTVSSDAEQYMYFPLCWIFTLAAHYDLGSYTLLPHMIRSLKRKLTQMQLLSEQNTTLLLCFKKIAAAKTNNGQTQELQQFLEKIQSPSFKESEHYSNLSDTLSAWIQSKLLRQPMMALLKPA